MKKARMKLSVVAKATRWIFILTKFCGINYFTLPSNRNDHRTLTLWDIVSLIACVSVVAYIGYRNMTENIMTMKLSSVIVNKFLQYLIIQLCVSMIVSAFTFTYHHKTFWQMFLRFNDFDLEVNGVSDKNCWCQVNNGSFQINRMGGRVPTPRKAHIFAHAVLSIGFATCSLWSIVMVLYPIALNQSIFMYLPTMLTLQYVASSQTYLFFEYNAGIRYRALNDLMR